MCSKFLEIKKENYFSFTMNGTKMSYLEEKNTNVEKDCIVYKCDVHIMWKYVKMRRSPAKIFYVSWVPKNMGLKFFNSITALFENDNVASTSL